MNFRLVLLLWLLNYSSAQDAGCNFYQNVVSGSVYYIYSPNWPGSYYKNQTCRWTIGCPQGYNCRLECPEISLPQSSSCSMDRLLVSLTGDPTLAGAQTYCGSGSLNVMSIGQRLTIGLITSSYSTGGRFQCRVTAVAPPAPQCSCGVRRQNRIVGGQETGVNEYPMMAGIIDLNIRTIKCGGVIISNRHVVTAAHCMYLSYNNYAVLVGEHNIDTTNPYRQLLPVSKYVIHPSYSSANYDYDIAIVTVTGTITFNERVLPVCLPFNLANNDFAGAKVTVLGWGTLFIGGPTSKVLRKVDLDVLNQNACRIQQPGVTARQLCTFTPGKDACQDDSGGPLLFTNPSNGLLYHIGIVSYGQSCASNNPGINTRVTVLLDWISRNTDNYSFCIK